MLVLPGEIHMFNQTRHHRGTQRGCKAMQLCRHKHCLGKVCLGWPGDAELGAHALQGHCLKSGNEPLSSHP